MVSSNCQMDKEITSRLHAASASFGRLRQRVLNDWNLTQSTKIKVYQQCVMPLLLNSSETWTLYQHRIRDLRKLQQRHLGSILCIPWQDFVPNDVVLSRACVEDVKIVLARNKLHWFGHVARMKERPVKALLYGELQEATRRVGRPLLHFKDTVKHVFRKPLSLTSLQIEVNDRGRWKAFLKAALTKYDKERRKDGLARRARRYKKEHTY